MACDVLFRKVNEILSGDIEQNGSAELSQFKDDREFVAFLLEQDDRRERGNIAASCNSVPTTR